MAVPIPQMLKYSIVYKLLNFPPILIRFVSKFIVKFFILKHNTLSGFIPL